MADHVVHRGANRLGERRRIAVAIVQRGWNAIQIVDDEVVADLVQFVRCGTSTDVIANHVQHACCEFPRNAHFGYFAVIQETNAGGAFEARAHRGIDEFWRFKGGKW